MTIKTATYTNKLTGETYELSGVKDIAQAWRLYTFVCNRTGWNPEMFHEDVLQSE